MKTARYTVHQSHLLSRGDHNPPFWGKPVHHFSHRGLMETVLEMISLFPPQVVIYVLEEVLSDPKHLLHAFMVPTTLVRAFQMKHLPGFNLQELQSYT